jgi:predicted DNA binding CopG/RHH family protein
MLAAAIPPQIGGLMKKRLPPAKSPLPNFPSDEAAAEYFDTHSMADIWETLPESKPDKLSKALASTIRKRHAAAKSPISIRLGPEQIAAAKKIAAAKSVGYQTQLRMWIAEGIRREARRA